MTARLAALIVAICITALPGCAAPQQPAEPVAWPEMANCIKKSVTWLKQQDFYTSGYYDYPLAAVTNRCMTKHHTTRPPGLRKPDCVRAAAGNYAHHAGERYVTSQANVYAILLCAP